MCGSRHVGKHIGLHTTALFIVQELTNLREWLTTETKLDISGWPDVTFQQAPEQRNGFDCGVFVCRTMDHVGQDALLSFSQDDMPYLRLRMTGELLQGELIRDNAVSSTPPSVTPSTICQIGAATVASSASVAASAADTAPTVASSASVAASIAATGTATLASTTATLDSAAVTVATSVISSTTEAAATASPNITPGGVAVIMVSSEAAAADTPDSRTGKAATTPTHVPTPASVLSELRRLRQESEKEAGRLEAASQETKFRLQLFHSTPRPICLKLPPKKMMKSKDDKSIVLFSQANVLLKEYDQLVHRCVPEELVGWQRKLWGIKPDQTQVSDNRLLDDEDIEELADESGIMRRNAISACILQHMTPCESFPVKEQRRLLDRLAASTQSFYGRRSLFKTVFSGWELIDEARASELRLFELWYIWVTVKSKPLNPSTSSITPLQYHMSGHKRDRPDSPNQQVPQHPRPRRAAAPALVPLRSLHLPSAPPQHCHLPCLVIKASTIPGAGDGCFTTDNLSMHTVVAVYVGLLVPINTTARHPNHTFRASHPFPQWKLVGDPSGERGLACKVNEPPATDISTDGGPTTNCVANLIAQHLDAECFGEHVQLVLYYTAVAVARGVELTVCYGSGGPRGSNDTDDGTRGVPPSSGGLRPADLASAFSQFCDTVLLEECAIISTFGAADGCESGSQSTEASQGGSGEGSVKMSAAMDAIYKRNALSFPSRLMELGAVDENDEGTPDGGRSEGSSPEKSDEDASSEMDCGNSGSHYRH